MARHLLLTVAVLVGSLFAQTPLPVPGSHAALEGSSSTNVPFGRSVPTRVQYVYDGSLFAGPVTITEVAFRLDGASGAAAKLVDCEMSMSTSPLSLLQLSVDFASNRGANATVVLARQLLTLPAQASAAVPNAFLPPIPLTTPFSYDPAQGPLVLEVVVFGQPPGTYSLDVTYVCTSPMVEFGSSACIGSTGSAVRVESVTTQVMWGRPWILRTLDAPPNSVALLAFGTTETGIWDGFLLPYEMSPIGAAGCHLLIDAPAILSTLSDSGGTATFPLALPSVPALQGLWIYYQGGALDLLANPLGLVTSRAHRAQVCGWEPVARVWSNGISAAIGTREIGLSAVVQFTVQ
ncbi:MAG: hypothetical protein JNL12_06885 [Planctomycetes bacterium]|nr:hypothetical protein [Planctomycetota bacterium]